MASLNCGKTTKETNPQSDIEHLTKILRDRIIFSLCQDAVSKHQEVSNNLEFAKELQRSFMALSQDVSKAQIIPYNNH